MLITLKKTFSVTKNIIILGIVFSMTLYVYTKNYWKKIATNFEIKELISEIRKAKNLPEKFYDLYEIENPKSLTSNLNSHLFYGTLNSNFKKPPSSQAAVLSKIPWQKVNSKFGYKFLETSLS